MEKISVCRICLARNVRFHNVHDKKLQEIYEKITSIPFETKDSRLTQLCYMCYARLRKCYQFVTKCLETEKMFRNMMEHGRISESILQCKLEPLLSFSKVKAIDIIHNTDYKDDMDVEVKEEPPDVSIQDDDLDTREDVYELQLYPLANKYMKIEDEQKILTDSEDDVPLSVIKTEETQVMSRENIKNEIVVDLMESIPDINKSKLEERNESPLLVIPDNSFIINEPIADGLVCNKNEQNVIDNKKTESLNSNIDQKNNLQCTNIDDKSVRKNKTRLIKIQKQYSCDVCNNVFNTLNDLNEHNSTHIIKKPFKCETCRRGFSNKYMLNAHIRTHTDNKFCQCDNCQCNTRKKKPNNEKHIPHRRIKKQWKKYLGI